VNNLELSVIEATVREIWSAELQISDLTLESDFFELGGDSRMLLNTVFHMSAVFGLELSPGTIYHHSTIRSIAKAIDDLQSTRG
jgi:acyl carrier protein